MSHPDRLPPHSPESEQALIGCILLDAAALDLCHARFRFRPAFYDVRHRTIYDAAATLHHAKRPVDIATLSDALRDAGKLDEAGGLPYLTECANATPSASSAAYYIEAVAEKAALREIIETCTEVATSAFESNGDAAEFLETARARLAAVGGAPSRDNLDGRHTWAQLSELDTANDQNCLVGRRYICRGHGVWLIGPSGIGKSSLLLQIAVAFALGRSIYGIAPARPLRCLVVQAENDEGDLAEMVQGLVRGMQLDEFGADDDTLAGNLFIRTTTGRTGAAWCAWLRRQIEATGAEIVFVDPLLSFAGIDVSRQDQCSQFLRVHLDPVLRETGAAMIAAHHTGKPPRKEGGGKPAPPTIYEQAYAGLGSSELVNWARACMVLDPVGDGFFRLTLSKRGQRAGASHPDGQPTRVVWLRHARQGIFWEQEGAPTEPDESEKPTPSTPLKGGRPSTAEQLAHSNLHEVLSVCPEAGESANQIGKRLHAYSRKHGKTVGERTCREGLLDLLIDCKKLRYDEATGKYLKGPNA